jgi:hypothetical protein
VDNDVASIVRQALFAGWLGRALSASETASGRGLHSPTFQLNLSALYGIEGALRDCVARVQGMLGDVQGV